MLAENYFKIKYKNKCYKIEDFYKEQKEKLKLENETENTYFCGLPTECTIQYKGKEYNVKEYKIMLGLDNIKMLPNQVELNDNYLNILYDDFYFQFQVARVNLIKSIFIIQRNSDMNWANHNAYIGMHYLRTTYFLNAVIPYRHLIDKLYKVLGIMIDYNKTFENFSEYIKEIDNREKFNNYWEINIKSKEKIKKLEVFKLQEFREDIDKLADFLNNNQISKIANEYKHRGLYIERGLKRKHYKNIKYVNGVEVKRLDDKYVGEVLEFDLDKEIENLKIYNNKVVEFINKMNTKDVLNNYRDSAF